MGFPISISLIVAGVAISASIVPLSHSPAITGCSQKCTN